MTQSCNIGHYEIIVQKGHKNLAKTVIFAVFGYPILATEMNFWQNHYNKHKKHFLKNK